MHFHEQVNIAAVREFYEARYRRHTLLSDDRSTTGSGLRLSQPLQAPSWWDRILTTLSNPWTLLPRNSDFSIDVGRGTASLRDIDGRVTTYAIPQVSYLCHNLSSSVIAAELINFPTVQIRPLDILPSHAFGLPTDEDEDERTSSDTGGEAGTNPLSGPPTTVPPRLPLRTTVPLVVQEAIGQIKVC